MFRRAAGFARPCRAGLLPKDHDLPVIRLHVFARRSGTKTRATSHLRAAGGWLNSVDALQRGHALPDRAGLIRALPCRNGLGFGPMTLQDPLHRLCIKPAEPELAHPNERDVAQAVAVGLHA